MARKLPPGPYRMVDLGHGVEAPFYLLLFTKNGRSKAPKTRAHLVESAGSGRYNHLFIFSHGWNNDFRSASTRYGDFIEAFGKVRRRIAPGGDYRPLLVGVIWPSAALVAPWEKGPKMVAASAAEVEEAAVEEGFDELDAVAELLPEDQVERFYDLAQSSEVDSGEARELATLLHPLFANPEDPGHDGGEAPSVDSLVAAGQAILAPETEDSGDGEIRFGAQSEGRRSRGLGKLDPRNLVRVFTAWQMKDRAGVVGVKGVGALLRDLIAAAPRAKVHLVGHSYGAKVVLSSLTGEPRLAGGSVESVLLLQPAVNGWAFAEKVLDKDFSGGYRHILPAVRQAIMTTFSSKDAALTRFFHLAVRREGDLGEARVLRAAAEETAPRRYAALGGFGPQGCPAPECRQIEMPVPEKAYPEYEPGQEILALRADHAIGGHGDFVNDATAWALLTQVLRS